MNSRFETSVAILAAVGAAGALHLAPRAVSGLPGLAPFAPDRSETPAFVLGTTQGFPAFRTLCVADEDGWQGATSSNMSISHTGSEGSFKIVVRDGQVIESSANGVYSVVIDGGSEVRVENSDGEVVYRLDLRAGNAAPPAPQVWRFGERAGRGWAQPVPPVPPVAPVAPIAPGDNRPRLGVGIEDVDGALAAQLGLAEGEGLLITSVAEGSAAQKAGVLRHDILTRLNGQSPVTLDLLLDTLRASEPGDEVSLRVLRAGKPLDLTATLEAPPAPAAGAWGGEGLREFWRDHAHARAGGDWEAAINEQMRAMEEHMRRFNEDMERMGLQQLRFGMDMNDLGARLGRLGGELGRLGGLMGEAGERLGEAINADIESQLRTIVPRMLREEVEKLGGLEGGAVRSNLSEAAAEAGAELRKAATNINTSDNNDSIIIHFRGDEGAETLASQTFIALEKRGVTVGRADQRTIEDASRAVVERLHGASLPMSAEARAIVREEREKMEKLEQEMHEVEREMRETERPQPAPKNTRPDAVPTALGAGDSVAA